MKPPNDQGWDREGREHNKRDLKGRETKPFFDSFWKDVYVSQLIAVHRKAKAYQVFDKQNWSSHYDENNCHLLSLLTNMVAWMRF